LCRGQADALRIADGEHREPLERQRQVNAALGRRERVDLVDDDGVDRAQAIARATRIGSPSFSASTNARTWSSRPRM